MLPKIKICCISSEDEAKMALQYGATALGLVGNMPSGPGVISDELIAVIAAKMPIDKLSFLLTSRTSGKDIIAHHHLTKTNTLQFVDKVENGTYELLRKELPHIKLVQVIHVIDERNLDEALAIAEKVDYLLLDSGNPNLAVKELGGTGRVHNWNISKQIVQQSKVPVFLAGGLHSGNVKEALDKVNPYGFDLCSGVRTNKKLDEQKLNAFFNAALQ
jgi:phosphoribosylanthranilate isomerase